MIVSWSWVWKKHLLKGWGEVHHMKNCGGQGRKPIACDLRPLRQHCITKPTCLYKGYFYLGSETLWKTVVCWLRPHFIQFLVIMEVMSHGIFLYFTQSQLFLNLFLKLSLGLSRSQHGSSPPLVYRGWRKRFATWTTCISSSPASSLSRLTSLRLF